MKKYFITGGAGFIGSHIAKNLIKQKNKVVIYDNFSSGTFFHLKEIIKNKNLKIFRGDIKNLKNLKNKMKNCHIVIHCAANPDIAKAQKIPTIDFWEGTFLTQNVLEAMRLNKIKNIIYMSGSGVYGENKKNFFDENFSPKNPISTYGASKLSCEAMISSYCHMFGFNSIVFRFANVVGPLQTHGVSYDFIKKIKSNKKEIKILGNGKQLKSYIHISDVINAIFFTLKKTKLVHKNKSFNVFNVSTNNSTTVNQILKFVLKSLEIKSIKVKKDSSIRGWSGDVPIIKLNCKKIKSIGWKPKLNSNNALKKSIESLIKEL